MMASIGLRRLYPFQQVVMIGKQIFVLLLLFLILTITSCHGVIPMDSADPISAKGGILDLRGLDITQRGVLTMNGEWEFVYGAHIPPEETHGSLWSEKAQIIQVPSTWKGYVYHDQPIPGTGIATYRLTIFTDPSAPKILSLLIPAWESAYTLYINGVEARSAGIPGTDHINTISSWQPQVVSFITGEGILELVFHISNFTHARGGTAMVPFIGTPDGIRQMREKGIGTKLFTFGSLLMISIYHFVIFLLRRKEKTVLYFSLFCLVMGIRALVVEEHCLVLIAPMIPWDMHVRITYLALSLLVVFPTLFVNNLFKEDFNRVFSKILIVAGILFSAAFALTPTVFFTDLIIPLYVLIAIMSIFFLLTMSVASYRRREGGILFLVGFSMFFLAILNDMFFHQHILATGTIVPIASLLFVSLQAIVLARRYATSYVRIEELSTEKTRLEVATRSLHTLSFIDPLTGLANRRRLDKQLDHEWRRAIRDGTEISFIMADIDFFKKYNDSYGHPAGDKAIRMVASAIQSCAKRPADLVARYGGEEFAILLPGTGIAGAISLAEEIRLKVLSLEIPSADTSASESVSLSLGCASMKPPFEKDKTELVKQADHALYEAKQNGRNRTEWVAGNLPADQ